MTLTPGLPIDVRNNVNVRHTSPLLAANQMGGQAQEYGSNEARA